MCVWEGEGGGGIISSVDSIPPLTTTLHFFKSALKKNLSPSYVKEDLLQLGLSEEKAEWVSTQWKANFISMSRIAASQSLTVNQLVDMEWKFGGNCLAT